MPARRGSRSSRRHTLRPVTRSGHTPVLLEETLSLLAPQPGETALDCTVGLGGHAEAVARRLGPTGALVINDIDEGNLAASADRIANLPDPPRIVPLRGNFAETPRKLAELRLHADVVLADLGFASSQVDDPARGFSFMREGPLDMRLDPGAPISAADLVNQLSERELATILRELGEERQALRIARKLVAARADAPIATTTRLTSLIREAVGPRRPQDRIDPATRTFQALRIAVNDEIGSLERLLDAIRRAAAAPAGAWLAPGARIGVISFHSLEDRPVKNCFRDLVGAGVARALSRKPITASDEECAANPRSRSAKLRAIQLTLRSDAR